MTLKMMIKAQAATKLLHQRAQMRNRLEAKESLSLLVTRKICQRLPGTSDRKLSILQINQNKKRRKRKKQLKTKQRRVTHLETLRFQQLLEYKTSTGDCNVPLVFPPNPQLGRWVMSQRQPKDKLLAERKARLDAVGFVWDRRLVDWKLRFDNKLTETATSPATIHPTRGWAGGCPTNKIDQFNDDDDQNFDYDTNAASQQDKRIPCSQVVVPDGALQSNRQHVVVVVDHHKS